MRYVVSEQWAMVRSNNGPVVAAAVAVLEQQSHSAAVLRRAGAVSVLPRRHSASTTDSDADVDIAPPGMYWVDSYSLLLICMSIQLVNTSM